jgi:ABC-type nitrate/sulfonate/bicarbonate transport system ATPase subunit
MSIAGEAGGSGGVGIRAEGVGLAWAIRKGTPVVALDGVNCAFEAGKVTAIIGPSGCGKSTLLQIVRGFLAPSIGRIAYVGGDGRERPPPSMATVWQSFNLFPWLTVEERPPPSMATVWQSFNLFPWLTVEENVGFGLELAGVAKAERQRRIQEALAAVDLGGFEGKLPRQLSGGMRQRVGLARALVMNPDVLLLDEPFGALDAQTRLVLQDQLAQLVESTRKTAILVTHSIEESILLADTVLVMTARPGRIAAQIAVDIPRPRGHATTGRPEYTALFEQIYGLLRDEVVRAMRGDEKGA